MGFAYKINDQQGIYFITCTVVEWVDVFSNAIYKDMVIESLKFCQDNKGLLVYGWVIMSNHMHLIVSCKEGFDLSNALRDLKKFTSTTIVDAIGANKRESRRNWLLWLLKKGEATTFWQPGNHPEEIYSMDFFLQKLNYIHLNPVRAHLVYNAADYVYSSAKDMEHNNGQIKLSYLC